MSLSPGQPPSPSSSPSSSKIRSQPDGTRTALLFAAFTLRWRAFLLDAVILTGALVGGIFLISAFPANWPLGLKAALLFWPLFLEPLMVARFQGTFGHLLMGIRVVDEKTLSTVSVGKSFYRWFIKNSFSLPSFLMMYQTQKHQSLHDLMAKTVVVVAHGKREKHHARGLALSEKPAVSAPPGMELPSRVRKVWTITAWSLGSFMGFSLLINALVSPSCVNFGDCTSLEKGIEIAVSVLWMLVQSVILGLGVQSRLWGARARPVSTRAR